MTSTTVDPHRVSRTASASMVWALTAAAAKTAGPERIAPTRQPALVRRVKMAQAVSTMPARQAHPCIGASVRLVGSETSVCTMPARRRHLPVHTAGNAGRWRLRRTPVGSRASASMATVAQRAQSRLTCASGRRHSIVERMAAARSGRNCEMAEAASAAVGTADQGAPRRRIHVHTQQSRTVESTVRLSCVFFSTLVVPSLLLLANLRYGSPNGGNAVLTVVFLPAADG